MKIQRICVLGGTGFVGHHLINRFARDRVRVRVLSRFRERHRDLFVLPTVDVVEANVHDPATLRKYFSGVDAVVNLVGILNQTKAGQFRRVHVELPGKVVAACREAGVRRILHVSAGRASASQGTSEYLRTKGEGEDLVMASIADGLQPTVFRPSVIFGPGDSFLNRFAGLIRTAPYIVPLPCPQAKFAPVYVGDVVNAYAAALGEYDTVGERYELCGPGIYTLRQIIEMIIKTTRRHRQVIGLGQGLSRLMAAIGQYLPGNLLTSDNFLSMQMDNICGLDGLPNGLQALDIRPTALESILPSVLGGRRLHPYQGVHRA